MRVAILSAFLLILSACGSSNATDYTSMTLQSVPGLPGHTYPTIYATTHDADLIASYTRELATLPVVDPGMPQNCPADTGYKLEISLVGGAHVKQMILSLSGCRFLALANDEGTFKPSDRLWLLLQEVAGKPLASPTPQP